ncbi:hypothetical protein B0H12DRAFT_1151567 [Mycena haematopus]|nr:hypothetical protein B0H12DRAFT_1151567 [Mycena haematopus]
MHGGPKLQGSTNRKRLEYFERDAPVLGIDQERASSFVVLIRVDRRIVLLPWSKKIKCHPDSEN